MESNKELSAIFKELNLENRANLLRCAQVSRTAENAVRKVVDGQKTSGFETEYLVAQGRTMNTREEFI
jgi:Glu-tRNA(Gln) amidotransferase subunit E-like FAD-binding protein